MTAIRRVATVIPMAIQGASPPEVSSGLKACDDTDPENPPVAIATPSTRVAAISTIVNRLIGVRDRLRSVRYQCPRNKALYAEPRNAAPASSWNTQIANDWRPVVAIATSAATDRTVAMIATMRPADFSRTSRRMVATLSTAAVASASWTARAASPSPGIAADRAASHAGHANSSTMIADQIEKKDRLVSFHRGVAHVSTDEPATVSARMSANTPAKPVMGALSTWPIRVSGTAHLALAGTLCRMNDWRSYDRTAATYERVHAPRFAEPARDLATLAGVTQGSAVLDVGTGTGIGAKVAQELGATAVGVDPSEGMLDVARSARPDIEFLAAQAIDLPFADGRFDVVMGNFVLAHFAKVETALFDIMRVTRPGGVIAFTTWADGRDAFTDTWLELVSTVVPDDLLEPTLDKAIPNHERFTRREAVEEVLLDAGLRHVRTEPRQYEWRYGRDEFVDGLTVWATGRFVREMLGEDGWASFLDRVRATFAERFPDPLHDRRDVLLAIGTKE